MSTQPRMTSEYQRAVSDFVGREVHANVSMLISELALLKNCDSDYYDDILNICVQDDYQTAAEDEGWHEPEYNITHSFSNERLEQDSAADNWQMLCDEQDIEPYVIEALEHWIVSDWLVNELSARGEMVSSDIYGLNIWGRATSGQAISIDAVICDIYDQITS